MEILHFLELPPHPLVNEREVRTRQILVSFLFFVSIGHYTIAKVSTSRQKSFLLDIFSRAQINEITP